MTLINSLTPEQEALIPVYREKWRAIALSTERVDRKRATEAVKAVYPIVGFQETEIIFCVSPYAAYNQLKDKFLKSLANQIDEQLKQKQHIQFIKQLERGIWSRLLSRLAGVMDNQIWHLLESLYSRLGEQILNKMEGQILPSIAPNRWAAYVCWFDFCITVLDCQYLIDEWSVFKAIALECGWIFPFEEICIVCDRPTKFSFDEEDRLHAEGEPAIEFADGFCIYAYHGDSTYH